MARQIQSTNEYAEKLVKLVPTEIIAAYLAIEGIVSTQPLIQGKILTFSCIFLLFLIPFYLWFAIGVRNKSQIIISMVSFIVWTFSIGGPFLQYRFYLPIYGSIVLILWTITVPLFNYGTKEEINAEP